MLGAVALGIGFYLHRSFSGLEYKAPPTAEAQTDTLDQPEDPNLLELGWDDAGQVDVISLELGYGLIPMVDADTGGRLLNRLKDSQEVVCGNGLSAALHSHSGQP